MAKRNAPIISGVGVPKIEIRNASSRHNHIHTSHHSHQYTTEDTAKDSEEQRMDKLSLIFRNEPQEIQQKLVNLLISMYFQSLYKNKDQDMFQVDLLIPFQSEEQKKNFMRQFLEIRKQKNVHFLGQTFGTPHEKPPQELQWIGSYDETNYNEARKFSFNSHNENNESNKANISHNVSHQKQNRSRVSSVTTNKNDKIVEEPIFTNQTGQFQQIFVPVVEENKEEKINFEALGEVIARRLKVAIDIINLSKENMSASQSSYQQANTIQSNEGRQEGSIIDQISNSISLGSTQKISQSKHGKQDSRLELQPSIHYSKDEPIIMQRKPHEVNYATEHPHYMEITEEPEEEEYQPLFNLENKEKQTLHSKVTAFEDYTRQYASIKQAKQNKNKTKNTNQNQRHSISEKNYNQQKTNSNSYQSQRPQKTGKNVSINIAIQEKNQSRSINSSKKIDANVNYRNKTHQKNQNQQTRNKINNQINVFFNTYRKSLDKLYSQIRQRIQDSDAGYKKEETNKSFEDLYILVCDDLPAQSEGLQAISEQGDSSTFKDEMIKQYHKQILVTNQNLSSEDLVRYFRYLHSNAKKLYIRYLKNRTK